MIELTDKTQPEYSKDLASRVRTIRRSQRLSQARLAEKSGVSLGSVKRFERTGEVSLSSFIKILIALRRDGELDQLLVQKDYSSIEEVIVDACRSDV